MVEAVERLKKSIAKTDLPGGGDAIEKKSFKFK